MQSKEPKKITLRCIRNWAIVAVLLLAVGFSMYVTICTARGKPASVFGNRVLLVETGSMEPSLHVGDSIIIHSCDAADLKVNDIISYYSEQADIRGMLVTHRIREILEDGTFRTWGDANPVADELPVRADQILGKYIRKSAFYTWLGSFTDSRKLLMLLVLIPMTLVSLYELRSLVKIGGEVREEHKEEREEQRRAAYEQRMREAIEAEKKRLAAEHYQPEPEKSEKIEKPAKQPPVPKQTAPKQQQKQGGRKKKKSGGKKGRKGNKRKKGKNKKRKNNRR